MQTDDMTEAASAAFADRNLANPYLWSSPMWLAFEAGRGMAQDAACSGIAKAAMSRGCSVRVTLANRHQYLIKFSGDRLQNISFQLVTLCA